MANKFGIGDTVATSMQQIIRSDEHKRIFFNKKATDPCCPCKSCDENCPCKDQCLEICKTCVDKHHIHDTNCVHDKTSAVNEIIDLLSKISTVQDELGLVKSSVVTMQALAMMVTELKKTAQIDDTNDMRWEELSQRINDNPTLRREFRQTELEDPEIVDLLRRRIEDSHLPNLAEEGVSADPASDLPPSIIEPPIDGEVFTWSPSAPRDLTELPPLSLKDDLDLPGAPKLPDIDRTLGEREIPDYLKNEYERAHKTVPVARSAFNRLNELLTKQAQEEGSDFEDEPSDEDEIIALMEGDLEEQSAEKDLFGLDGSAVDDMWASDLDEEMESGDFLGLPEDEGPGFNYRGSDKYRDPHDVVRVGPGEWEKFDELSPEERLELEMGAGLHEQLDMDPDELSDEEAYPELWAEIGDREHEEFLNDADESSSKETRFWNSNE